MMASHYPLQTLQPEQVIITFTLKMDGANAPVFVSGSNVSTKTLPVRNSTGDFTVTMRHPLVGLTTALAYFRWGPLGGVHPASGKAYMAHVVNDGASITNGTSTQIMGASGGVAPTVHIQTFDIASGIPTVADPDSFANVPTWLDVVLVCTNTDIKGA